MKQQVAKLNYLRIAPRKVRLVASALKGLSVNEAEAQLMFRPQRSSEPLLKLLRSAVANAKNNQKLDEEKLYIKTIKVDGGPMLKRFLPRAMGRATPLQKKMSHVTVILEEREKKTKSRFNVSIEKKKVSKKEQKEKAKKAAMKAKTEKPEVEKKEITKAPEKSGFLNKVFRRKTI